MAPWLLSDPGRMSRMIATSLPALDGTVTFDSVRLGWLGPLVMEGIRVVPRSDAAPPLSVARIEIGHGLAAILASFGDVGSVRVLGMEADLVFDERGRSNIAGLFTASPRGDGVASGRPPGPAPVRMRLEIDDAVVRIDGPWSPEPWRSGPITVRATLAPAANGAGSEWAVGPVQLLSDARLEPGVAQGVLAYIAPVLAGATRTGGRFSLRLDGARLPLGRPADGNLSGTLSMHEVVVGPGPLVDNLLGSLPARLPIPTDIRIADESNVAFRLADRRVSHEGLTFGVPLAKTGQRLDVHSSGSVGIDDGSLDLRLRLPVPLDLPQDRPLVAALAGKEVSIGIRGELSDPRAVFDGSIKEAAAEFAGDLVERLTASRRQQGDVTEQSPPTAGDDTAAAVVDLVGGLLEEVAKRRAERRAQERENPDPAPPRRLRERLRGGGEREPAPTP